MASKLPVGRASGQHVGPTTFGCCGVVVGIVSYESSAFHLFSFCLPQNAELSIHQAWGHLDRKIKSLRAAEHGHLSMNVIGSPLITCQSSFHSKEFGAHQATLEMLSVSQQISPTLRSTVQFHFLFPFG
ncbi:hypothetical protein Tco_0377674 [Tanacetum coccineum]